MTSLLDTEQALWNVACQFRGVLDSRTIVECTLALFFLKYASDVSQRRTDGAPSRFVVPPDADFNALLKESHQPGNAERIEKALLALERANPDKLDGLFGNVRFRSGDQPDLHAHDAALSAALKILNTDACDFSHLAENEAHGAYESLIAQLTFESHSNAGELYTPRQISTLLAQLADPRPGNSIYDPACGTAGLLLTCEKLLEEHYKSRDCTINGQEINRTPWMLAKMNALTRGKVKHRIVLGDTLRNPLLLEENDTPQRFDVVVSNPPFSLPNWGWEEARHDPHGRFKWGLPPKSRGDYAFILHMLASMNPFTGRMAVIAPHGVLFRGGSEAIIRRNMIESNLLDAVIGLPPKLFYNTGIETVILSFRAERAGSSDDRILFVDASRECAIGRRLNELRQVDIERIIEVTRDRATVPGYSGLVTREQIAANDYNLNLRLYVRSAEPEQQPDFGALVRRERELAVELVTIQKEINICLQDLGMGT